MIDRFDMHAKATAGKHRLRPDDIFSASNHHFLIQSEIVDVFQCYVQGFQLSTLSLFLSIGILRKAVALMSL